MSFGHRIKKLGIVIVSLSLLGLQLAPAQAAMVGTEQLVKNEQARVNRAQLLTMLERGDVQAQLMEMGVDPQLAQERVAGLTDAEIAQLNDHLAELPAGSGALEIILIILLVFIITDIIGVTNIFPFINPPSRR